MYVVANLYFEEMTTVESLTVLIFLEMHRDKMRGTGHKQQQGKL